MRYDGLSLLSVWLILASAGCGVRTTPEQAEAISLVEGSGGSVKFADDRPGRPVIEVRLGGAAVIDGALARLACFPELETLALFDSQVNDARAAELKPLKSLQTLYLGRTQITDVGLEALGGMSKLQTLGLSDTRVTDSGLALLKSLKALRSVNLRNTLVTDAGVRDLKRALPELVVHR